VSFREYVDVKGGLDITNREVHFLSFYSRTKVLFHETYTNSRYNGLFFIPFEARYIEAKEF